MMDYIASILSLLGGLTVWIAGGLGLWLVFGMGEEAAFGWFVFGIIAGPAFIVCMVADEIQTIYNKKHGTGKAEDEE